MDNRAVLSDLGTQAGPPGTGVLVCVCALRRVSDVLGKCIPCRTGVCVCVCVCEGLSVCDKKMEGFMAWTF